MRKRIKSVAGSALIRSGWFPRAVGDRAVIVAWHRIDDRYRGNPITYSVDGFRRFCEFFKEHFDVVSLSSLLDSLTLGRSIRGQLVITFDDGYRDNLTTAAPILREFDLPATFFIATGFIGSSVVPWWDAEAGIRSEWMSWEDVRALARMGFAIGAHTVNHVDLGVVYGDDAQDELSGARNELEESLGHSVDLFAFPYGREHQLSEENRRRVAETGFRCAPSCCGGLVSPGDDPFRLRREPIGPWIDGPEDFALDLVR